MANIVPKSKTGSLPPSKPSKPAAAVNPKPAKPAKQMTRAERAAKDKAEKEAREKAIRLEKYTFLKSLGNPLMPSLFRERAAAEKEATEKRKAEIKKSVDAFSQRLKVAQENKKEAVAALKCPLLSLLHETVVFAQDV